MSHNNEKLMITGATGYQLMHDCYRKGVEQFKNRFYFTVYADKDAENGAEEIARRLVACWNALDGVPTEWLENYVACGAKNLMQENAALVQERDELLAALRISTRGLRHCSRWNISEEKEKALMTQVITNETILAKYKEAE